MAESSLMLPIAGVFLVACVSGIMSQSPPSQPLPPPPPSPPPSPTLPSPPPPSPTLPSPPPPSPTLPSPPPPSPPILSPPPPSVPPPTSPPPPPQPPPLPPPSSPPLPSSPPSPPLSSPSSPPSPPLSSPPSPPSPPLSSPSSPPLSSLSSPSLPPTLPPLSSLTPSSLPSLSPISLPPISPISLPPLSPISLPPISPISLPPLSPSSPLQAPATPPTSGVVYSKPSFNSTFFVHESLLVVAGPGGNLKNLQLGSVVVVTDTIRKTSDPSSKVLGVFKGQYVQDGNETLHVTATATIYADSKNPYNTTYEIVGQRTSLTSTDGFPLSVVSGIQFNLETKEYSYGLLGIAFIDNVIPPVSPKKLSSGPSPSPNHPSEVEVPQALEQNVFQISIFFCKDGRCQF